MRVLSLASDEHWRAFDAEAQLLARALRGGRLTVLLGASGAGKTTLLFAGVLPLLRRRVDDRHRQPRGAAQVVVPFPDQRSRVPGRGQGEQLYVVDQWNEAPLDWLLRALDTAAAPQDRTGLAEAMSPAHLSALSQRHGGARLLFMFDHFELLLKGAQHKPDLQRFVQAWAAVVQAPELDAHFLVAVDERAWPRFQALRADMPGVALQAFRLQVRSGRQMLELLTDNPPRDGATELEVSDATFEDSIDTIVPSASPSIRQAEPGQRDFAAAGDTSVESRGDPPTHQLAATTEEAVSAAIAAADHAAAERAAEAQRVAQAQRCAEAAAAAEADQRAQAEQRAEAERGAEAARQAKAAQRAEAHRHALALAAAEAAAARDVQARQAAEAAAEAASIGRIADAAEAALAAQAARVAAGSPAPVAATARPARTGLLWGAALLAAAIVAALWWPTPTPPAAPPPAATSPASLEPAAAPAAESAPAESGGYEVLSVTTDGSHGRIARELAGALSTGAAGLRAVPQADGTDPITWLQAPGRLAIARLDALRAARGSASPPLRVLTPLFPEAVLFVVGADSPLKYIHELNGRRLSIGPVRGDGSHTVREMYRQLFGAELTEPAQFDNDQALAELVAFRSIDAMALVEPQPSAWWASLDPGVASRLRLLTLDPRHPADRRLLQTLGTPVVRVAAGAARGTPATTPAVMSYLVASGEGHADADRLTEMARALCRELPRLREQGHPLWRELQPTAQLDTGWPVVQPFQSALSRCARR